MASRKEFLDDDIFNFDEDEDYEVENELPKSKNEKIESVKDNRQIRETKIEKTSEIIESKPILEVKKTAENPFANKYKKQQPPAKPKKKKTLKKDINVKKLISISQKNIKVVEILKNLPKEYASDSDYICQAIIEKYERENNKKETDMKTLVKDALEELVGEKYIIMKGSSDIQVGTPVSMPSQQSFMPTINQSSINQAISAQEEDERESLLLGIIDDMDDDI